MEVEGKTKIPIWIPNGVNMLWIQEGIGNPADPYVLDPPTAAKTKIEVKISTAPNPDKKENTKIADIKSIYYR